MSKEIWKPVKGFEGLYEVSNLGNIRGVKRSKNLKTWVHRGYVTCKIHKDGRPKCFSVHRLQALAFIPNPLNKPQVNHINTIKHDNRIENLEWCDNSENQLHAVKHGKVFRWSGKNHHASKSVAQCDLEGNFIKDWESINQAAKALGLPNAGIQLCCKNKLKKSGGYVWKYK